MTKFIKLLLSLILIFNSSAFTYANNANINSNTSNAPAAKIEDPKIFEYILDTLDNNTTLDTFTDKIVHDNLNVNYQNENGMTPLLLLMRSADNRTDTKKNLMGNEIAKILLLHGAKVGLKDKANISPFDMALRDIKYNELLRQTVIGGYELDNLNANEIKKLQNMVDMEQGNSLAHYAVLNNSSNTLQRLIELRVRLDIKNNQGKTPIIIAIENNNVEMVKILLANLKLSVKEKKLTENLALKKNNIEIINMLK